MKEQTIFKEKSSIMRYKDIIKERDLQDSLSSCSSFSGMKNINFTDNLCKDNLNPNMRGYIRDTKFLVRNSIKSRLNSIKYALEGLEYIFRTETNIRIHLLAGVSVILAAWYLEVTNIEMILLLFSIISVIVSEIINTALEISLDIVNGTKFHYGVKIAKDIIASAVLLTAINAAIVGIIILGKYII